MAYIDLPIELDPDVMKDDAIATLQDAYPGWNAAAGNLEVILLEAVAEMSAEQAAVAAEVPSAIFRQFGSALVGLPPIDGIPAIGSTTWNLTDAGGHIIPAGTYIAVQGVAFQTTDDTTIAVGESTATIGIVAVDTGTQANDLTGTADLIDTIAYVDSVTVIGTTSGGVDAETDDEYLDRLTAELQLMAPRPIVPTDFEVLARNVAGVDRAVALDLFDPTTDNTFTADTHSTTGLTAVSSFTGVAVGSQITGSGIPANTYVVAFDSGAGTITLSKAATATAGGVTMHSLGSTDNERTITIAALDVDGAAVSSGVKSAIVAYLDSLREVNFNVYAIDPTFTAIDVTATITVLPGFDSANVIAVVEAALTNFFDPANWGRLTSGDGRYDRPWVNTATVGYLNVARTILTVEGVAFIDSLTVNGGTTDVALGGPAPVTTAGTMTVTEA